MKPMHKLLGEEHGQVLPIVALMMTMLLAMAALGVDVSRVTYAYRQLQASTDAAALAGARAVPTAHTALQITGPTGWVQTYSAASGGYNASKGLPSVTVTSSLKCLSTLQAQGGSCVGSVPYNAVQVQQTAVIPLFFAGLFGKKTQTISTVSTAAVRGGSPQPTNIVVLMDTTLSMNIYDSNCGQTQIQCALNGLQVLLLNLQPCGQYDGNCGASDGKIVNPFDQVALFTFPNVSSQTASIDTSCTTPVPAPPGPNNNVYYAAPYGNLTYMPKDPWPGIPTGLPFSFPTPGAKYEPGDKNPTYQITDFLADYRLSVASTSLNPSSSLTKAVGAVAGCGGMLPSNYDADWGTYYAGAIYAAQSALVAQQQKNTVAQNVIIILSDGDSNATTNGNTVIGDDGGYPNMNAKQPDGNYLPGSASGLYPSWFGECGQAVDAAAAAAAAGTRVYSVAYGSGPTGCASDQTPNPGTHPNISPCLTMSGMASAPQYFFSDYLQSNSNSTCVAGQVATSLTDIFRAIAADLSGARLIPNNTN